MIRNFLSRINNSQKGFTTLELVFILGITAAITGIMIANFRTGDRQKRTMLAADTLMAAIRQAQNFSLSGKQIPSNLAPVSGSDCRSGDNSADFYRVAVSASGTSVATYADHECGNTFLIESTALPQRTRIRSNGLALLIGSTNSSPSSASVRFSAPFGRMTVNGGSGYVDFTAFTITIEATDDTARTKAVRIDGVSGKVGD